MQHDGLRDASKFRSDGIPAGSRRTYTNCRVILFLLIALSTAALPRNAAAAGTQTIKQKDGPPTLQPINVVAAYSPPGYDFIHVLNWLRGFNGGGGGGGAFSYNNPHSATTDKKKDKAGCQGHVGDPVEVDDGAKLLSFPLFSLPGEMGLEFTLYYHSKTGSAEDTINPWASSIDYLLDTRCVATGNSTSCDQVVLYRPDGSSLSFSGNYAAYGNFPEIGGGGLATLTHNSDGTRTLHDEGSTVQTYDSAGHATSIKDTSGIGWTITRSSTKSSDLTEATTVVTHTDGQSITIVSDTTHTTTSASRQVTVTDPPGTGARIPRTVTSRPMECGSTT
jgi:hypothetical protein